MMAVKPKHNNVHELIRSAIHSSRTVHLSVLKEVVNYQSIFIEIRGVMLPQNYCNT